jgi:hypothetical protein
MLRRFCILTMVLIGITCSSQAGAATHPQGCAAYSSTGMLATVTLESSIQVETTSADGKVAQLKMPLSSLTNGCRTFFSRDSGLLAIALEPPKLNSQPMQIALLDVRHMQWVRTTPITVNLAMDSLGQLQGFVGETEELLVLSSGLHFDAEDKTTLFPVTFDLVTQKATTAAFSVLGSASLQANTAIDLRNSTIWKIDRQDPSCSLSSFHLKPEHRGSPEKSIALRCSNASFLLALRSTTVAEFSQDEDRIALRLVDTQSGAVKSSSISPSKRSESFWLEGKYAVSPDEKLLAIAVKVFTRPRFGNVRVINEIFVVNVDSLSVIAKVPFDTFPAQFVVANLGGRARLSSLIASGWQIQVVDQSAATNVAAGQ